MNLSHCDGYCRECGHVALSNTRHCSFTCLFTLAYYEPRTVYTLSLQASLPLSQIPSPNLTIFFLFETRLCVFQAHYIAKEDCELPILLPPLAVCREYPQGPPHLVYVGVGFEPRTSVLTELHIPSPVFSFWEALSHFSAYTHSHFHQQCARVPLPQPH